MQYRLDSLGLSGTVTTLLRDLIHERLGLFYDTAQFDQLADRLAPLVAARGLQSFMDFYYALKYTAPPDEWRGVMDALAVHETYFWREIDQLRAVVREVVPALVDALDGRPLRIWSVPCASGEEPLTLAMLLSEAGWFARAPIEIAGSDASPRAIALAQAGLYRSRSFRNLSPARLEQYFAREGDAWRVSPALHRRVTFSVVNLMDAGAVAPLASAPIILCRNVFIYFSDQSIRRGLGVFERAMPSPGFLCVGASESLLRRTDVFELEEIGGAFIYVKGAARWRALERRPGGIERVS
jgi:chemotaxis protein methyltransferase CheR